MTAFWDIENLGKFPGDRTRGSSRQYATPFSGTYIPGRGEGVVCY